MTKEREERIMTILSKRQNDLTLVLENVTDPHNISAVMRSCDAVGIQEIFILNTKIPKHRKWGKKSSSSAEKWLTIHQFDNVKSCFEMIKSRYDFIISTKLSDDAVSLYEYDLTKKTAIIFGNEHDGVSDEIASLTGRKLIIPQVGMVQSLNISVACAVTLYEAFRQKQAASHYTSPKLNSATILQLKEQWGL